MDNCEIRWEEDSKYDTEISAANAAWEALAGSDSCVDIEPDAWNTNEDLEWSDVNRPGVSWAGRYYQRTGADDIYLNTYYSDNYGACDRKALAMHELGHAHGIDESGIANNIMGINNGRCTLGSHDIQDYEGLWGDHEKHIDQTRPFHCHPCHRGSSNRLGCVDCLCWKSVAIPKIRRSLHISRLSGH